MTAPVGSSEWLRKFVRDMQDINAAKSAALTSPTPSPVPVSQFYESIDFTKNPTTPVPPNPPEPGWGSKMLDYLFRPLYGSTQAFKGSFERSVNEGTSDWAKQLQEKYPTEFNADKAISNLQQPEHSNIWGDIKGGLSGENKTTYRDVVDTIAPDLPNWVKTTAGLTGDIFLDPANIVLGPLGHAAIKGGKYLYGTAKKNRELRKIEDFVAEDRGNFFESAARQNTDDAASAAGGFVSHPLIRELTEAPSPAIRGELPVGRPEATFEAGSSGTVPRRLSEQYTPTIKDYQNAVKDVKLRTQTVGSVLQTPFTGMRNHMGQWISDPVRRKDIINNFSHQLTAQEKRALNTTRSPERWNALFDNVLNRLETGSFNTPEEFAIAARNGFIPLEEANKVLDKVGANNIDEFLNRYHALTSTKPVQLKPSVAAQAKSDFEAAVGSIPERNKLLSDTSSADIAFKQPKVAKEAMDAIKTDSKLPKVVRGRKQEDRLIDLVGKAADSTRRQYKSGYLAGGLKGASRSESQTSVITDSVVNTLKQAEEAEKVMGVRHYIDEGKEFQLGIGDALSVMPKDIVDYAVSSYGHSVPPTSVTSMIITALKGGDKKAIKEAGAKYKTGGLASAEVQERSYIKQGFDPNTAKTKAAKESEEAKKRRRNSNISIDRMATWLSKDESKQALWDQITRNKQIHREYSMNVGNDVAAAIQAQLTKDLGEGSLSKAVDTVTNLHQHIRKIVPDNPIAEAFAARKAGEATAKMTNKYDVNNATRIKENVNDWKKADEKKTTSEKARRKVQSRERDEARDASEEAKQFLESHDIPADPEMMTVIEITNLLNRKNRPFLSMFASWGHNAGYVAELFKSGASALESNFKLYTSAMYRDFKDFTTEQVHQAFRQLQKGLKSENPAANALQAKVKEFMSPMADFNDPLYGGIFKSSMKREDIQKVLDEHGVGWKLPEEITDRAELANSWRELDVDNPIEFMTRLHGATLKMQQQLSIGSHLAYKFGASKGGMHNGIRYVRVPKGAVTHDTEVLKHIPDQYKGKAVYYPEPVVEWITNLERTIKESTKFEGKTMNNYVDPALALWKAGVTIIRPGHHVRNMLSDITINGMQGIVNPKYYRYAAQTMREAGLFKGGPNAIKHPSEIGSIGQTAKGLEDLMPLRNPDADFMTGSNALMGGFKEGVSDIPKYKTLKVKLSGGHELSFDATEAAKMQMQHGILPSYKIEEDIIETAVDSAKGLNKFANKILGSKPLMAAGHISEFTSHYPRMAQFEHLMRNPKFTSKYDNMTDLLAGVADRINKAHPLPTGLAPSAMKYMRRIFPFFSWFRQIVPFVAEMALTKPKSVTIYPKIINAIGEATGTEGRSPVDPYPVTRFIPSFIRNGLGYVGGDHVFNLGTPQEAVFGDILNGNPARNIMSMLNPAIKAPIEMTTRTNLGTGSYIADMGEYLDSNVPGVSQASSISGYSTFGTLGNILTGNMAVDPQRVTQKGEKDAFFNTSLVNFITGLGIQNFDRPSYQKIAKREMQNRKTNEKSDTNVDFIPMNRSGGGQ